MNGSLCDKHGKFYVLTRIRGEDGKLRKKVDSYRYFV